MCASIDSYYLTPKHVAKTIHVFQWRIYVAYAHGANFLCAGLQNEGGGTSFLVNFAS